MYIYDIRCNKINIADFRVYFLNPPSSTFNTMVEITIRKRSPADAVATQRKFFKKTARGKVVKGACPFQKLWQKHKLSMFSSRLIQFSASATYAMMSPVESLAARPAAPSYPLPHHPSRKLSSPRKARSDMRSFRPDTSFSPTRMSSCTKWIWSNRRCSTRRLCCCRQCWRRCAIAACHCMRA